MVPDTHLFNRIHKIQVIIVRNVENNLIQDPQNQMSKGFSTLFRITSIYL